jgi:hypothetical protein
MSSTNCLKQIEEADLDHQINEFDNRHTFECDDFFILQSKFPHIKFRNIPDAWILLIDELLSKIDTSSIKSVSQFCGFIKIVGAQSFDVQTIEKFEKRLFKIDIDYFEGLCGKRKQSYLA